MCVVMTHRKLHSLLLARVRNIHPDSSISSGAEQLASITLPALSWREPWSPEHPVGVMKLVHLSLGVCTSPP